MTKEKWMAIAIVFGCLLLVEFPGLFVSFTTTFAAQIITMVLVWLTANIACKLILGKSLIKILKDGGDD